jgi:hypothetical protein
VELADSGRYPMLESVGALHSAVGAFLLDLAEHG